MKRLYQTPRKNKVECRTQKLHHKLLSVTQCVLYLQLIKIFWSLKTCDFRLIQHDLFVFVT